MHGFSHADLATRMQTILLDTDRKAMLLEDFRSLQLCAGTSSLDGTCAPVAVSIDGPPPGDRVDLAGSGEFQTFGLGKQDADGAGCKAAADEAKNDRDARHSHATVRPTIPRGAGHAHETKL